MAIALDTVANRNQNLGVECVPVKGMPTSPAKKGMALMAEFIRGYCIGTIANALGVLGFSHGVLGTHGLTQ
jgi:hypothetical protein